MDHRSKTIHTITFGTFSFITSLAYRGDTSQFQFENPFLDQPSYTLWDLSLVWNQDSGRWSAGLHGKNLTDEEYKVAGYFFPALGLENNITAFDGVAEAAVIGIDDEILGQAIKAFIVLTPGENLNEKQLLKLCADNMETFAVPKYIEFVESLPKTPNGKIDKKKLKNPEQLSGN